MRASALRPGFTVEVDKRGDRFPARVDGHAHGRIQITPLRPGCGYHSCTPREVKRILDPPGRAA